MSTIILPDRWRHQPKGSSDVDWGNSLCRDLTAVVNPAAPRTLITNELITPIGTGSIQPRQYGKAIVCLAGSYGASVAADADSVIGTANNGNEFTLALVARFTDTTARASSLFGFVGTNRVQAHAPYSDGTIYWDFGGTGNRRTTSSGFTKSTNLATFVFQYGVLSPYRAIWYNGQSLASSTTIDAAPRGATTDPFYLGGAVGQAGDNVEIYFAAFARRVWSAGEITEFHANPWQLLKKKPRILYFPSAGGGATITGDSGSYTLTGTAATLKAGRKLAADSGTYNLTGTAAALKVGRKLTADSGTYTLTGTAVAFKRGYALGAESGTYTVSGTSVNLKAGRKLTADSGSYALTGTDVTLNYSPAGSYNLTAESGTYTLTGTAATLKVSRKLTADSGTYALTGTAAGLAKGVRLTAESGSYTLTGSNVAFARTYVLTAESGAYTLTGTSAGLTWSGAPVVEVPTNGGPSIYGKPVFREKQFRKEYEEQVKRIEDEKRLARILREDEEITVIMALMAA